MCETVLSSKTSYRVVLGPPTQKLKPEFQSLDHHDPQKVYMYVEQEGAKADRIFVDAVVP